MTLFKRITAYAPTEFFFIYIFCWPCILLWFMVNDQLDTQFFSMYLFQFSTCIGQPCAHHQENQLYQYNIWYMSLCVGDRFVCRSERSSFSTCTWNGLRHRVTYQRLYWYNWFSWWWARGCWKHVENWNKFIEKNCASSWSFTLKQNYCVTIQKVHVSQQLVHWLFWVTFCGVFLSPWGTYLETDHGITSSLLVLIKKYYHDFVRSKKLCLTVMGDESLQSRLLQHIRTCFVISITAVCVFQTAFF